MSNEHATAPKRTTTRAKRPHLRAVPDPKKRTAKQAKDLAAARAKVAKLTTQLNAAKKEEAKVQDRCRPRLPNREEVTAGGFVVKRTFYTYLTFSLKDYKAGGGKVTAAMKPHVHEQSGESWTVKPVK
jgi:hypothetical protein